MASWQRRIWLGLAGIIGSVFLTGGTWALTFAVIGGEASPGDTPDVCVAIPDNDGTAAGVQMDLVWDSSCLSVDLAMGQEGACFPVSSALQRKMLRSHAREANVLRVLMLSLSDTTPIPAEVKELFCCQFRVSPAAAGRTCTISLSGAIASDPVGNRLPNVRTVPGAVVVRRPVAELGGGAPGVGGGAVMMPPVIEGGAGPPPASGQGGPSAPAVGPAASDPSLPRGQPQPPARGGQPAVPVPAGPLNEPIPGTGGAMGEAPVAVPGVQPETEVQEGVAEPTAQATPGTPAPTPPPTRGLSSTPSPQISPAAAETPTRAAPQAGTAQPTTPTAGVPTAEKSPGPVGTPAISASPSAPRQRTLSHGDGTTAGFADG